MPTVSVSIPCYNATSTPQKERWLRRSIESVLNQTFEDFELLLIDDGSSDETAEVLQEYAEAPRVEYIYQENQGYAGARNTGLEEGNGEYFAFIGQDDVWLPTKLEQQLEYIRTSDADIIHTNVYHIGRDGTRTGTHHESSPPKHIDRKDFIKNLFLGNFVCIQSVLAHHSVFETRRFDERFQINCDHDMWMRVANEHDLGYLDEKLVEKRFHDENTSSDYERMFEERKLIAEKMANIYPFLELLVPKKLSDAHLFYGIDLVKQGQTRKARQMLRRGIQLDKTNWEGYVVYLLSLGGPIIGKRAVRTLSG